VVGINCFWNSDSRSTKTVPTRFKYPALRQTSCGGNGETPPSEVGFMWEIFSYGSHANPEDLLPWGTNGNTRYLKFGWENSVWPDVDWTRGGRGGEAMICKDTIELAGIDMMVAMADAQNDDQVVARTVELVDGYTKSLRVGF